MQPEANQPGCGQDDRVVLSRVELAQTGVQIAAQGFDLQTGITRVQEGLAAQAGGADDGTWRQIFQPFVAVRNQRITGRFAGADCRQHKAFRHFHRHVLERMHGKVGLAFLHGDFQFLDEQALAADLRERAIKDLVAARGHAENFDAALRVQDLQTRLDMQRLPHRQTRFTRGDDQPGRGDVW